jgi:hypothetical protein
MAKDLAAASQIFKNFEHHPSAMLDVKQPQALAIETIAHFFRCSGCTEPDVVKRKTCFERAKLLYTKVLRACCHSSVNAVLSDTVIKTKIGLVTPVPDIAVFSADGKRRIAHCFAGLALCALFGDRSPIYFCSLASASLAWDCPRKLELAGMLRIMLLIFSKYDLQGLAMAPGASEEEIIRLVRDAPKETVAVWQAIEAMSKKLILPMVLGKPELLSAERILMGDEGWDEAVQLAEAMNARVAQRISGAIPNPKNLLVHTHLVENQIVERKCDRCGVWEAHTKTRFSRCAACKAVYYCGRECQTEHWKEHKRVCKMK